MSETYDERRKREANDPWITADERGPGHETYDEKLERYRRGWRREFDDDR